MIHRDAVKANLGIADTDTDHDSVIDTMIAGVTARFARAIGSLKLVKSDFNERLNVAPRSTILMLPAWPVVAVSSITESCTGDHTDETPLTATDDYLLTADNGRIDRVGCCWLYGIHAVAVSFTAGYTPGYVYDADGYEPATGEVRMGDDLTMAAAMQVGFDFDRRRKLGVRSISGAAGDVTSYASDKFLPAVANILHSYKRWSLC